MRQAIDRWFFRTMAVFCLWLKRDAMAIEYWERLRAMAPADAKVPAAVAHALAGLRRPREAIAYLRQSLELDPSQPGSWFNLGYLHQEIGEDEEAIAALRRAIRLDEKLDRAWYGLALSLLKCGQVDEAVAALKRNTELQPMSPYGWYQLAHAYLRQGERDKAERVIHRLAKFEPKVALKLEQETGINSGVKLPF
ncbi:MAG: tetratricopeptide repeat protein [Magnetospirillum sp.]|nr:tetratricopeptide repeat protein [Magnetospirillum sp.]